MRQFVIELSFIGLQREKAELILDSIGIDNSVSARGIWTIVKSGTMLGPDGEAYEACKLVTAQISLNDLPAIKILLNRLYNNGAMVAPSNSFRIHFVKGYSENYERRIISYLVADCKYFYTFLFYPRYSSLLDNSKYSSLTRDEKLYHYKILINTIDDRQRCRAIECIVCNALGNKDLMLRGIEL